jgi:hypothetical protein
MGRLFRELGTVCGRFSTASVADKRLVEEVGGAYFIERARIAGTSSGARTADYQSTQHEDALPKAHV